MDYLITRTRDGNTLVVSKVNSLVISATVAEMNRLDPTAKFTFEPMPKGC